MIFAAGLGTRLRPLTDTMPKALVRVGGQPLLWHVLMRLRDAGFERIVVNVHHFASQIVDYLDSNSHFGLDIRISDESGQLLETGGGIRKALPLLDAGESVLIHNVDILSNADLEAFYLSASQDPSADAWLIVNERSTSRYLLFDGDARLAGWTNVSTGEVKSPYPEFDASLYTPLAFSGIHLIAPSLFPMLRQWPDRFPIMDFYLRECDKAVVRAWKADGLRLLDVGKLNSLADAERFVGGQDNARPIQ